MNAPMSGASSRLADTSTCPFQDWSEPVQRLAAILPVEELFYSDKESDSNEIAGAGLVLQEVAAILFRTQRCHPLVVGPPGIGKTHFLRKFGCSASSGEFPALGRPRCLRIDCRHIGPADSRACLELIFEIIRAEEPLILCLDGIGALLRRANGGSNSPLLCSLLDRPRLRVIGVTTPWEYTDLIAGEAEFLRRFAKVALEEPAEEDTRLVVHAHAQRLAAARELSIAPNSIDWLVRATTSFLLAQYHPAKDLDVLREACERRDFERKSGGTHVCSVDESDFARVISDRTGIPVTTVLGQRGDANFVDLLTSAVAGQSQAVETVARELRLIQAGLTAPDKPASVMLFAGLTGVGKTELAKRIAECYSSSRRLQVYPMGNFTEPHSVSSIIGVPPGYVGHEQGGRLINDLNADPYSVFLLDEAEKCHPNIWKPFLNLFDEGWIVDQRGVKARADRAIFILTTNAGDRHLAQLAESSTSAEEVAEAVRQTLSRVRLERSSQPVFPAQFLARLRRIIVFRPLTEAAMVGIAQRCGERLKEQWRSKRAVDLRIEPAVWEAIGRLAQRLNQERQQQEGGRVVQKLIDQVLQDRLQQCWLCHDPTIVPTHLAVNLTDVDNSMRTVDQFQELITVAVTSAPRG